jgi:hypothetical protein
MVRARQSADDVAHMPSRSTRCLAAASLLLIACGDRTALLVDVAPIASTTAPLVCPDVAPDHAAACATVGKVCVYPSAANGECGDEAGVANTSVWRCEHDGWSESARCIDVNACPTAQPKTGDACDAALEGVDCFYATPACDVAGITRCSGGHFQGVNDCGARSLATCNLQTVAASAEPSPVLLDGQSVGLTMATAGVEDLVGGVTTVADDVGPQFLAATFDSHAEVAGLASTPNFPTDVALRLGLSIATSVLDRWWVASPSDVGGGIDVESVRVDGDVGSHRFGVANATPVALAMTPVAGWAAYLAPSAKPSASQLVLMPLDGTGAPSGAAIVVDDESPTIPGDYPVAHAAGAVARRGDGVVVAFTVPANGDLVDNSGVMVEFLDDATATTLPSADTDRVRVSIGPTGQVAIAPLADGAVLLATTAFSSTPPTELRLARIERSGAIATLAPIKTTAPATIDAGIQAISFDGAAPSSLHVTLADAHGAALATPWSIDRSADDFGPFAITVAPIDASIHVAYFDDPIEGEQLSMARAYCAESP